MEKLIVATTKLMLFVALLLSNMPYPAKVLAQNQPPSTSKKPDKKPPAPQPSKPRTVFVWPKTPANLTSVDGRVVGMGSRNLCNLQLPIAALTPFQKRDSATKQSGKSTSMDLEEIKQIPMNVWGLTTSERPTFWFYVPYTKDMANLKAEFVLQDRKENDVYRKEIALPSKPGIISVSLPATVAPLKVDKTYIWNFKISCEQPRDSVKVDGAIQRINPSPEVAQQLTATSDPRVKIAIYAAAGIWYDSLTLLAQLRLANPNDVDLATDWQTLLESVEWSQISTAPLVN